MSKLDFTLYELSGMTDGDERNFNHIHCPAGTDTKRRLYIKRVSHGYLFYCHHCGLRGRYRERFSAIKSLAKTGGLSKRPTGCSITAVHGASGPTKSKRYCIPEGASKRLSDWPVEARKWVLQYGITKEEVELYGICYAPTARRVVLPLYDGSDLASYQTRRIYVGDEKPKYITYRNYDCIGYFANRGARNNICVLVEDYLSAVKVSRQADCYYLQGTTISTAMACWILRQGYKQAFVWLDDDNRTVKKNQIVLKNTLDLFIPKVEIVHTSGVDPKAHTDEEIKRILRI